MYGAILGDIIGSKFEFDNGGKTKEFELFERGDSWTDDTVMTVAVAEALMSAGREAGVAEIEAACVKTMQKWGQRYPHAGYGARFIHWISDRNPKPYNSYGNGSAMRVSAAGWLYDTIERTREVARATANVSHNHPEGLKGAECTAAVIFLARTGAAKQEIEEYVKREFGYDFSETLEEMRARHSHDESCMDTLPKALRAFFDGTDFEDVVRNAVSLGGDADTIGAIAGAMGEAMYGVPARLKEECLRRIKPDMRATVEALTRKITR
jgi:ADP-ribosylglycohydrolase